MIIITSHTNSDFDSLGAMIGARKLYPGAKCVFPGSQETTLRRFFLESSGYAVDFAKLKDIDLDAITLLVVVDTDGASRIGPFGEVAARPGVRVHIYDHHPLSEDSLAGEVKVIERVGAATTILAEIIEQRGIPLSPEEATLMLIGIFEDTGGLTFSSTMPRDFAAAGFLAGCGADLSVVRELITPELTAAQVALLDELLKNRVTKSIFGVEVVVSGAATEEYVGDMALLAHKMCDMEGITALVVYARMGDRIHMVMRSRVPEFDGAVVARHFGGGGHPEAASATVRDMTTIEVEEELYSVLPLAVKPGRTARDLLSSPVKTVEAGRTIGEARDLLNRYPINGLPVMEGEELKGMITRLVVERAYGHGLLDSPVDDYMTTDFLTVDPDASLEKTRAIIVGNRQRLLPVMEGGRLIGVVTRTDLLNAMAPGAGEAWTGRDRPQGRNAGRLLSEFVTPEALGRLKELGEVAASMGMAAYLVGGMVRDLMLRTPNLDVDVVVEGDAIRLGAELAARWGGVSHGHPTFSTAKVKLHDGFDLDIASARTEFYGAPAALPTVEQSSLKLDLYRRDFTVNALALSLAPGRFGEIIDFFGGLRDLKDRSIRVIHNLSFVEDPTRVMRALRFSLRFGFAIGGQTRRLLKTSVAEGFVAKARGPRLFKEWRTLFEEVDPTLAAETLMEEGVLKAFHPKLHFDEKTRGRFKAVSQVAAWYSLLYLDRPLARWKLYFLALLEPLTEEEALEWARDFSIDTAEGRWLIQARGAANQLLASLRKSISHGAPKDSEVYRACREREEEVLLYAMARTADESKRRLISSYHTRLAGVKTVLTGDDLRALSIPPGPLYREILSGLLAARLDGLVKNREEEVSWVRSYWSGITGEI